MTSDLTIIKHELCQLHDMGEDHPESPERLKVLGEVLSDYKTIEAKRATREQLLLAHRFDYIDMLEANVPSEGLAYLDGDTAMNKHTLNAAFHAAGAACQAVDLVINNESKSVFCATRPPGHHAEPDRACGFCFFCNPYIAARHAQEEHGVGRVAIIDFDVHHGNGTVACLRDQARDDIMYVSTHQWPLFPGTGNPQFEDDEGGLIVDVPLPESTNGEKIRQVYKDTIFPKIKAFNPELIIVSAGFDAHMDDPLAGFLLSDGDYFWLGENIKALKLPVVSLLEGGYNLSALKTSVKTYLSAFNE